MVLSYYSWPPKRGSAKDWPSVSIPALHAPEGEAEAANYVPHPDLAQAVNLAIVLGKPLLVTGEPGTGKSRLAHSIAWQLGFNGPFKFVAKSTSQARDLFYNYDALGRFQAADLSRAGLLAADARQPANPLDFIEYTALGIAILLAHPAANVASFLTRGSLLDAPPRVQTAQSLKTIVHPGEPSRSVVLIDEIDKAPRDLPNDILDEIETLQFKVPEIQDAPTPEIQDRALRPVVIITSNQERLLPEPFLRRCLFFEIGFPKRLPLNGGTDGYHIENIVARRLGESAQKLTTSALFKEAIDFFCELRDHPDPLRKRPATAELIDWLDALRSLGADPSLPLRSQPSLGTAALFTLLKGQEDMARGQDLFAQWVGTSK